MKEINVTTTGITITPYRKGQNRYFENLAGIYDYQTHKMCETTGFYMEYEDDDSCYATHLHDLTFLQAQFPDYKINVLPVSKRRKISTPFNLNADFTPKEVQYELIQQILSNENKRKHQWFIYLSQGLGKTLLSIYLMTVFNVKTIIICYNKEILNQWKDSIKNNTSLGGDKILKLTSSRLLEGIVFRDFPSDDYDVFLATPALLNSFGKKHGHKYLSVLMEKLGIGFKIFDEAHRNISNLVKINAFTSIDKTLYLSGDFGQSDNKKEELYFKMFHNVPILRPSPELMETLKFTEAIVVSYNSHPTDLEELSVRTKRGFSFYNYMKYQFKKGLFLDILDNVLTSIKKTNVNHYKVLILVNMIEHVDTVYDIFKEKYDSDYTIGKFHSQIPDEDKLFCKENCDMIISTYQSFSTGIDVSCIKYVISCGICTKIDDNQASGRARPLPDNSSAYYFMLHDLGFSYARSKLRSRLRYLQETKIKSITQIKYD